MQTNETAVSFDLLSGDIFNEDIQLIGNLSEEEKQQINVALDALNKGNSEETLKKKHLPRKSVTKN